MDKNKRNTDGLKAFRLTRVQKALLGALLIEVLFLYFVLGIRFDDPPERLFSVSFIDESELPQMPEEPEKKTEIPDISKYLKSKEYLSTLASNEWEEEEQSDENSEMSEGEDIPVEKPGKVLTDDTPSPEPKIEDIEQVIKKKKKEEKSFTGRSRISYRVPGRRLVKSANPLFICPDYMKGLVTISVEVTPDGRVVNPVFLPKRSTTDLECLIDASIEYATKMRFNRSEISINQKGVIKFLY